MFNLDTGSRRTFQLAHFSPQDVVSGREIAGEINAVYVGSIARLNEECYLNRFILFINFWDTCRFCKGIAKVAQELHHNFFSAGHQTLRIYLARLHENRSAQQCFSVYQITSQIHGADSVLITFIDIDSDIHLFTVWRNGDGRGIHTEFNVTIIEIERLEPLQVTRELLSRVTVFATEEHVPGLRTELEEIEQLLFLESLITNDVDMTNPRLFALINIKTDRDSVARQFLYRDFDRSPVAPAR